MINMNDIIDEFGLTYLRLSTNISTLEIDCRRELLETAYERPCAAVFQFIFISYVRK